MSRFKMKRQSDSPSSKTVATEHGVVPSVYRGTRKNRFANDEEIASFRITEPTPHAASHVLEGAYIQKLTLKRNAREARKQLSCVRNE